MLSALPRDEESAAVLRPVAEAARVVRENVSVEATQLQGAAQGMIARARARVTSVVSHTETAASNLRVDSALPAELSQLLLAATTAPRDSIESSEST